MFPSRWHVSFMETLVFSGVLDQRDITGSTLTELYQQTSHMRIFALKFNAWNSLVAHVCWFIIRFVLDQSIQRLFCSHLSIMILILREADWSKRTVMGSLSTSQVMGNQAILFFSSANLCGIRSEMPTKGWQLIFGWGFSSVEDRNFTSNPHLLFRRYYSVQLLISMQKRRYFTII